jgi:formamidopyrimidine-DNA glycosylase
VPELPEVETIRRALEPRLAGRRLVAAEALDSPKFTPAHLAVGATVTSVGRRGKYLALALDDDRQLVVHLGMTGQLRVRPANAERDPYVRARWSLDDGEVFELRDVRRFGRVAVVEADGKGAPPTYAEQGPDALDPGFRADQLWRALRASDRRVKTQLLSQRPVAGVGNIYADEALWLARIHPSARSVSKPAAERLHAAILDVLTQGVANGGTTLRDYRTFTGELGANQTELQCYGRYGEPCPRCGSPLVRRVIDARGTTFCSTCQRR